MPEESSHILSQRLEEWIRQADRSRQALLEANCSEALKIATIDGLRSYLRVSPYQNELGQLPDFAKRLDPILDGLTSFANAITSASQYTPVTCLIWGGVQAVIESACIQRKVSEKTLDILDELQRTLPEFDSYTVLFPDHYQLHFALQDVFDEFMNYCVEAARYYRKSSTRTQNYFTNLFFSASTTSLAQVQARIKINIGIFLRRATLAFREEAHQQHLKVTKLLTKELTEIPQNTGAPAKMVKIEWPVTTVTMFKNPTFVGRDDVLGDIEKLFEGSKADRESLAADAILEAQNFKKRSEGPMCCVLSGLGGIGKTQIALEYTQRRRGTYDAIFWFRAEHDWTLSSTYAAVADKLSLLESKTTDEDGDSRQQMAVEMARKWLETTDRSWLLVFDNVEDLDELSQYIPLRTKGKGDILVTTQKEIAFPLTDSSATMPIKPFLKEDAAKLLFTYLQREPENERERDIAKDLCDLVGGLPLAIATIGGYIISSGSKPEEYIETIKTSANAWTASAVGPVRQYEKSLATVFEVAIGALSSKARGLVGILAFLNPDYIPEAIFHKAIEKKSLQFLLNKADLLDAIRELKTRQLIRRDTSGIEPYLSIHRTVQWNVLLDLNKDTDNRWEVFQQAFRAVQAVLPANHSFITPSPEKWPKYQKFGPHVLSLRTHCLWPDPPIEMPVKFAQVLTDMGTFMWHAGKLTEGEEALETAVEIMDEQGVDDQDLRANVYELLGIMSSFEGVSERKYSMSLRYKAKDARHNAMDAMPRKEITKEEELKASIVDTDMAFGFVQQEDFEKAAKVVEDMLPQYRIWGPEDEIPYYYSHYYQIMSVCLMAAGKPVESIQSITHCADLLVKAGGVMHPMTQLMRFIAGYLTWHAGEEAKALEIHEAVLDARKKILGPFSHFTLESYSTCGYLLYLQGNHKKARTYLDLCLERRRRSMWNEEGVARAQFRYAKVLRELDEIEEAEKMEKLAENARKKALAKYPEYMPKNGDAEAIHDQMVSIWAGRFTGKLKQDKSTVEKLEELHVSKELSQLDDELM